MDNVWFNPRYANTAQKLVIFADRDGTLIRHIHYISNPDQIELLPGVKESTSIAAMEIIKETLEIDI